MKKLSKLMIAAGAATLALSANAAVTQTVVTSSTIVDVEGNPGDLSFAKFNASLGTLQSVQIELFNTISGDLFIENKGSGVKSFTVGAAASLTMVTVDGPLTAGGSASHLFSNLQGYDGHTDYAGGSGGSFTLTPWTESQSALYTTNLAAFTGTGNYLAAVSGESTQSLTGTGNNSYYTALNMDSYAKVTYTYIATPVPEPETYAMLLAGLGLVGAIARRRKSA